MESFEIFSDGKLPKKISERYGRELSLRERLKYRIFGIGFFKPVPGQENLLSKLFEHSNNTIRPHLDQLTNGLIFRLVGIKETTALVIPYSEIERIVLTRQPDTVKAIAFSPFWILLKLGFNYKHVYWLSAWYEFKWGAIEVTLKLVEHSPIQLVWDRRRERAVERFFASQFLKEKSSNGEILSRA